MVKLYYRDENVTLLQGDCLEVMPMLTERIDAVITDVPYGITRNAWDAVIPMDKMWDAIHTVCSATTPVVLFGAEPFASKLRLSNPKEYRYDWYWAKTTPTGFLNSKRQPLRNVECISVFYKKQCMYNPQMRKGFKPYKHVRTKGGGTTCYAPEKGCTTISNGERYPIQVITSSAHVEGRYHPTQKPTAVLEYLIRTYTNEGDTVLDFTCGSGSIFIAGLNLGRKVIGIELDEKWCEVSKQRIEQWYSQKREASDEHPNT